MTCGLLAASCLGRYAPTGVRGDGLATLAISPALIPSPADATALPVNHIRMVAARVSDGTVLGTTTVDVDPAAPNWTLSLDVRLPTPSVDVTLTVSLINVGLGGVESIQFSGVVTPLTLTEGGPTVQPQVPIVRGPPANVLVTGVTVTSAPDTLLEGRSATLGATATTTGPTGPSIYWTVLDTAVLSVTGPTLTGRVPGTGRVVASAGAHVDTATVVVRAAPTLIQVTPDTARLAGVGTQATYSAVVRDVRGATLPTEPLTWRTTTPSVLTSLGGGILQAAGTGTGTVEAVATAAPTVVGRAYAVVTAVATPRVNVRVLKTVDQPQPLVGTRIRFTVSATNFGPGTATNLAVFDTLRRAAFTSPAHNVSVGTLVGDSLWQIPTLASGVTRRGRRASPWQVVWLVSPPRISRCSVQSRRTIRRPSTTPRASP
ncbi:MAG: hypothetical protein FJ207_00830 [Gemmatimonadetes bacterium]|nr:hypothetical protein [Gemmatimonadota bacterium]